MPWVRETSSWFSQVYGYACTKSWHCITDEVHEVTFNCIYLRHIQYMNVTNTFSLASLLSVWWNPLSICWGRDYYSDVIRSTMASQITTVSIVYSTVCSGADQRKHQSSMSLAFVRGIHQCLWMGDNLNFSQDNLDDFLSSEQGPGTNIKIIIHVRDIISKSPSKYI